MLIWTHSQTTCSKFMWLKILCVVSWLFFSFFLCLFHLRSKSEVFNVFCSFQSSIQLFQCDNGRKFNNHILFNYFVTRDIKIWFSCPYTSQNKTHHVLIRLFTYYHRSDTTYLLLYLDDIILTACLLPYLLMSLVDLNMNFPCLGIYLFILAIVATRTPFVYFSLGPHFIGRSLLMLTWIHVTPATPLQTLSLSSPLKASLPQT